MKLEYLRTLVSIVEQGSLSAAARSKRISQPAVTKQVQRLEAELGVTLLIRGPRRETRLTPAGERVLAFARETLAGFTALEEHLALLKTPNKFHLDALIRVHLEDLIPLKRSQIRRNILRKGYMNRTA